MSWASRSQAGDVAPGWDCSANRAIAGAGAGPSDRLWWVVNQSRVRSASAGGSKPVAAV
ncbi:hypothetical protein GCM10009661_32840 [Catellatospora chokoriensis]|uniref:Uncharacterized protein n=1 Tax=Catellatospora chokoriensis TaxID=310353 RepID=A0A8J3K5X1_9ACTN|nr:hypothetical protein Cch02nite_47490 [Catellatospora chokoriensis]